MVGVLCCLLVCLLFRVVVNVDLVVLMSGVLFVVILYWLFALIVLGLGCFGVM